MVSLLTANSASRPLFLIFFFFNDTATTEIYTLSLHDALPISRHRWTGIWLECLFEARCHTAIGCRSVEDNAAGCTARDRKSTRLNSSHGYISYAVFCLKKKKKRHLTS